MFNTKQLTQVGKKYAALDKARRALQALCADILSTSKRAIFAIQRSDPSASAKELADAIKKIKLAKKFVASESRLAGEGMWRAALEEYAEATMYHQAMTSGKVGTIPELPEDPDLFLGGLSDLTGELTRSAVLAATDRDLKEVKPLF